MAELNKLIGHTLWANEEWITFIDASFPADEYLLTRMSHILLGEQAWFQRILGEEPDRKIWQTLTIPQLRELHAKHKRIYGELRAGNIARVIPFKRFTGEAYQSPISDILLHLTLHGAHHRGQMATYVSKQGKPPINTDYIQYCLLQGE